MRPLLTSESCYTSPAMVTKLLVPLVMAAAGVRREDVHSLLQVPIVSLAPAFIPANNTSWILSVPCGQSWGLNTSATA